MGQFLDRMKEITNLNREIKRRELENQKQLEKERNEKEIGRFHKMILEDIERAAFQGKNDASFQSYNSLNETHLAVIDRLKEEGFKIDIFPFTDYINCYEVQVVKVSISWW